MPCHYVIHKQQRLVVSTGSGRVTFAEMKAHQCQLLNDPDFNPEFNQLADGTAVTALELSVDEAKELARRTLFSATSRRAFVASSPAIYGMMRLVGSYHEMSKAPSNICAFYDLPSALNWLNHESLPDSTETQASRSDRADAGQDERIA